MYVSELSIPFSCHNYYRPHPKDGKGTVFTGVCQQGGTPWSLVPDLFPGLWSQVLSGRGCTPVLSLVLPNVLAGGTPCPGWGVLQPRKGYPQQDRGYSPDRTYPLNRMGVCPQTGQGVPTPRQDRGVPPPPHRTRMVMRCGWYASCIQQEDFLVVRTFGYTQHLWGMYSWNSATFKQRHTMISGFH